MAALTDTGPGEIVRLITCGSVDDGKSTLIGRLLWDAGAIPADQAAALPDTDGAPDLSFLVDGLSAEREQGITIDVAYRFFDIGARRFILADTPGHEQYTRNMVTAASSADVAVVLVDATRGVLTQTRRHTRLLALLGVRRVLLAVNKMDRVGWSRETFDRLAGEWLAFAAELGLPDVAAVPISARGGDNVVARSAHMPWFEGSTLVDWLAATPAPTEAAGPFRMAVQSVIRHGAGYRGLAGRVGGGKTRLDDARIGVAPLAGDQSRALGRREVDARRRRAGRSLRRQARGEQGGDGDRLAQKAGDGLGVAVAGEDVVERRAQADDPPAGPGLDEPEGKHAVVAQRRLADEQIEIAFFHVSSCPGTSQGWPFARAAGSPPRRTPASAARRSPRPSPRRRGGRGGNA